MSEHGTAKRRAARGAKWLDKKSPGWFRKIKRKPLNMTCECNCILGQLNGNYEDVAYKLGLEPWRDQAYKLGFLPTDTDNDYYDEHEGILYAGPLEVAWWGEIKARREPSRA